MSKAKTVVRIVFGVLMAGLCLTIAGAYFYFTNLPTEGELVFMAPGEAAVIVIDDGEPIELSDRGNRTVSLLAGPHTIKVMAPAELEPFEVEVEAFGTSIVPVARPQCFAIMDVSLSAYDHGGDASPRFVSAAEHEQAFELKSGHYTSLAALPDERTSGELVYLVGTSTCEAVAEIAAAHRDQR